MAHKLTIVAKPKPGQASAIDVSDETKEELEGFWAYLLENGLNDYEGHVAFDSVKEKNQWLREARTYCNTREDEALKFRQLNSKNLPAEEVRFQVTRNLPENGARKGKK